MAGLVAITPAAGFVDPFGALIIGLAAGAICFYALKIKSTFNFDDSLDVVAVHLVGGVVGSLLVGILAVDGVGGGEQFGIQLISVLIAIVFTGVLTFVIATIIDRTIGLRAGEDDEQQGLDLRLHNEQGYVLAE